MVKSQFHILHFTKTTVFDNASWNCAMKKKEEQCGDNCDVIETMKQS